MFEFINWFSFIGIILILVAWLDPLQLGVDFRVVAFILGFDILPLLFKIILFGIDYWYDISGLGFYLLIFVAEEIFFNIIILGKIITMIIKPAIVFLVIYINNLPLELAVFAALIDLLLNMREKLI